MPPGPEPQQPPHTQLLALVAALADPARRAESARRVAERAGAANLIVFIRDVEIDALLPAPGFQQTLPEASEWRRLLDEAQQQHGAAARGRLRLDANSEPSEATAVAAGDDAVLVLLGGEPDARAVADICVLMPLLTHAFRGESAAAIAEMHAGVARATANEAKLLASSLENARRTIQQALGAAEAANAAKDRFLAVLSHELRTPLQPVLMTVSAMEHDVKLSPAVRDEIGMIRRNVELEARLIDDLLDLTRIREGKLELHCATTDAHDLLQHAVRIVRDDASAKSLRLDVDFAAERYHVWCDAARLQQVLWNLLKNAVKFTPGGGAVSVRTRNVTSGGDGSGGDGGELLIVDVIDTGIGIEPQVLPRIFDAFEQGEKSITREFGGLGLGLAISKAIVELHGGTLSAWSDGRGKGARFTLAMKTVSPAAAAAETLQPSPGAPAAREAAGLRILLVEDDRSSAEALARLLRTRGYVVTSAATIATALDHAAAAAFDLVISDLGLPDGSGADLMRELRAVHAIPGIAISGYGMDEDVRLSKEAGFQEHLTKPVTFDKLLEAIARVALAK